MQDNKIVITIVGVIIIGTGWFQIDQSIKRSFEKGRRNAFEETLGNIEMTLCLRDQYKNFEELKSEMSKGIKRCSLDYWVKQIDSSHTGIVGSNWRSNDWFDNYDKKASVGLVMRPFARWVWNLPDSDVWNSPSYKEDILRREDFEQWKLNREKEKEQQ